ncbi:MAG: PH domain-containing protein [Candidatus Omnitrophica bacterium]|nr:PH domain-containing protein [Candidatus Omnitrophota bacterium]
MFKSKTKYTWEGWESSGKEDWVFSVKHPCELIGVHAKLIDGQLKDSEKVEYCIYSPRVSSTSMPFGLKAEESSSGICVTDKRFIISNNRHIKGMEPTLNSINFEDILSFNIGSAMLLSWFSLEFAERGDTTKRLTIIFSSNGRQHFQKALRIFKKYSLAINTDDFKLDSSFPAAFIHKIKDKIHRDYLKALLSEQEKCILTFSCRYVWEKILYKRSLLKRGKQVSYLTSKATALLTNKAFMIARDGVEYSIGTSVDIFNVSLDKVKDIGMFEENTDGGRIHKLRINFAKEVNPAALDILFTDIDEETEIFLNDIPSILNLTPSLNG